MRLALTCGLALLGRFAEAEEKLAYASKLRPDLAEYHVARGDLLQSELRLPDNSKLTHPTWGPPTRFLSGEY